LMVSKKLLAFMFYTCNHGVSSKLPNTISV